MHLQVCRACLLGNLKGIKAPKVVNIEMKAFGGGAISRSLICANHFTKAKIVLIPKKFSNVTVSF